MTARHIAIAFLPLILSASAAIAQDGRGLELIFDRLDADQDGEVSQDEIATAKARQFERVDADGDGLITETELAAIRERMARIARIGADGMTERARKLDVNGDKALSRDEFTATPPLLTLIDADGNGAISRAEFERAGASFSQTP